VQMAGSAAGTWRRLMGVRFWPVVLSSPYPPGECLRRLAMVTTTRGPTSWYLDSRTAGHPEPLFRGEAGPSRIFVARFADAPRRDRVVPWLDARLEPAAGGGSTLTGAIGLHPAVRARIPVLAGVAGLIAASALAGGVHLLASGHLAGLVPTVLAPLALAAFIAGLRAVNLRLPERRGAVLLRDVTEILGSAAASAGPAACPGNA